MRGFAVEVPNLHEDDSDQRQKIAIEGEVAVLRDSLASLNKKYEFQPGMIVRQKPGCHAYQTFSDNAIAVVVEVLSEAIIITGEDVGSQFYRQRVDMIIGERTKDGWFSLYHVDSRRFEPVAD